MIYNYKEMTVFKEAVKLVKRVYELTSEKAFLKDYSLKDQLRRSTVSIISNIAEGSGRGTRKDNTNFLAISRGSCCELQAQLLISNELGLIDDNRFTELDDQCDYIIRMLTKLINYMKYGKKSADN